MLTTLSYLKKVVWYDGEEEGKTNNEITIIEGVQLSAQSSLSIFAQKYFRKCEDTYFILQNKYLRTKILT